jgi:protocatechuate 3,4-dioxygenase alpha subunit
MLAPDGVRVSGRVLDGAGEPVMDALVELWGPDGTIGRCETVEAGRYGFVVRRPEASHLVMAVFARGLLRHVVTRMYFEAGSVPSAVDPERRETLVAGAEPDGSLRFDIRLQGERETVFFAQ